jgi:hypothetical protein
MSQAPRSSAAHICLRVAGAIGLCVLALVMLAGVGSSSAAGRDAHGSSRSEFARWAACKRAHRAKVLVCRSATRRQSPNKHSTKVKRSRRAKKGVAHHADTTTKHHVGASGVPNAGGPVQLVANPLEEVFPVDSNPPTEAVSVEPPPTETNPTETKPVEPPPTETNPTETKPVESPPTETNPTETKPVEPPPTETKPTETKPVEPPPPPTPFRFFSPASFWNAPLSADAPLDPNSAAIVNAFDEEVTSEQQRKRGPFINTSSWSVPIYTVGADEPTVTVTLTDPLRGPGGPALQSSWVAVPLPANAKPAVGSDAHLVVWQPSMDRLWEFWHLAQTAGVWHAEWGGAMQNVSTDGGVYGPEAWPGAKREWGASASSLPIAGGLVTLEDLELGQINHALAIALPNPRARIYASPAQRTDGSSSESLSLPEGAHLRLDPTLNLAAMHLPRLTLMLSEAAQRYGIIVRDVAGDVTFYGQDPTPTGTSPYYGAHGYFEGQSPQQLLAAFPWNHLQLLKMELHG